MPSGPSPEVPVTVPYELRAPLSERTEARLDGGLRRVVLQRWTDDSGVLIAEDLWARFRQIENALQEASTWGEFEDRLPPGEFDVLSLWEVNDGRHVYRRDGVFRYARPSTDVSAPPEDRIIDAVDTFHPGYVPGYEDGDYPPWMENMAEDLPEAFVEEFGHQAMSMVAGVWWEYPLSRTAEMSVALRAIGYELVRVATDRV